MDNFSFLLLIFSFSFNFHFSLNCDLTANTLLLQGGAEHKVPVVISKMFKDQAGNLLFTYRIL